jgi:hypothetical protein
MAFAACANPEPGVAWILHALLISETADTCAVTRFVGVHLEFGSSTTVLGRNIAAQQTGDSKKSVTAPQQCGGSVSEQQYSGVPVAFMWIAMYEGHPCRFSSWQKQALVPGKGLEGPCGTGQPLPGPSLKQHFSSANPHLEMQEIYKALHQIGLRDYQM